MSKSESADDLIREIRRVQDQQPYWALGGLLVGAVIGIPFLLWAIYS